MNKWLGVAVAVLFASVAFAQPGIEDYNKAQEVMKGNDQGAMNVISGAR